MNVPSRTDHVAKADGNAEFALSLPLNTQPNIDWALVALFYAALHYIEAYLAPAHHLRSHEARDNYVGRDANLKSIYVEYGELKYYGFNARYGVFGFTPKDVTDHAAVAFSAIKAHVQSLF